MITQSVKVRVDGIDRHFARAKAAGATIISESDDKFLRGRIYEAKNQVIWPEAPAYLPLPLSFTDCGADSALSMIISVALYDCAAVGANVTPIVHFLPAANGASQPFVTVNGLTAPLYPSINTVMPGFFLLPLGLLTVTFLGPF